MSESENVKVKQSVHNISYLNKNTVFSIRKKQTIDNIIYYWVKSLLPEWNKRFSSSEFFPLKSNIFSILLLAMQQLRSSSCMRHCFLKELYLLLFKVLSVSLIIFQIKKYKKKWNLKKIKSEKIMKSKNFKNSKISAHNQFQCQTMSVSDGVRI